MADIRTLKLNLLADTSDFTRGLHGATGATKTFAGRIGHMAREAALGFAALSAAAGAVAVKIGIDSVKAAIEDEASMARLAKTMHNTVKATDSQIKSTEDLIRSQQRLKGFGDSELRAAYGRLLASTKDITNANKLLAVAQDTARGTGRDLESVAIAIGKAYDGNLGALKRLGVPLDANIIKTKDTKAALQALTDLYGGQASTYAETFAGKMARLHQQMDILKEDFGKKLIEKLTAILPYIQRVADILGGDADTSLSNKIKSLRRGLNGGKEAPTDNLAYSLKEVAKAFGTLFAALTGTDAKDGSDQLDTLAEALQNVAKGINAIAKAWRWLFNKPSGHPLPKAVYDVMTGAITGPLVPARAMGGPVVGGSPYLVGERGPELFIPNGAGTVMPSGSFGMAAQGTTIININGVVDAESARRSIERIMQQSSRRSGPLQWAGSY